jgi:hypothetical protein
MEEWKQINYWCHCSNCRIVTASYVTYLLVATLKLQRKIKYKQYMTLSVSGNMFFTIYISGVTTTQLARVTGAGGAKYV